MDLIWYIQIETFDNNIRQHVVALSSTLTLISTVEHLSLPPNVWNSCFCMKPLCGLNNCQRNLTKIIFFLTRSNVKGCCMLHLNYIWNITWSLVRLSLEVVYVKEVETRPGYVWPFDLTKWLELDPEEGFLIGLRKIFYSNLIVLLSSGIGNLEIEFSINTFIRKLYKILIFASSFSSLILKSNAVLFVFMI